MRVGKWSPHQLSKLPGLFHLILQLLLHYRLHVNLLQSFKLYVVALLLVAHRFALRLRIVLRSSCAVLASLLRYDIEPAVVQCFLQPDSVLRVHTQKLTY